MHYSDLAIGKLYHLELIAETDDKDFSDFLTQYSETYKLLAKSSIHYKRKHTYDFLL